LGAASKIALNIALDSTLLEVSCNLLLVLLILLTFTSVQESRLILTRGLLLHLILLTILELSSLGFKLFELLLLLSAALVSFPSLPLPFNLLALISLLLDDLAHVVLQLHSDGRRQLIKLKAKSIPFFGVMSSNDLQEHFVLVCIKVINCIDHLLLSQHLLVSRWKFLIDIGWSVQIVHGLVCLGLI